MKDRFRVEIEMEQKMSATSKKSSSEYYELLLQIRFIYFEDVSEVKADVFNKITKGLNSINKVEEKSNGFDFYLRNHSDMSKIPSLLIKDYLLEEKRSAKLIGRDQLASKDKYRYTQSIIIINLKKGMRILLKGEEFNIKGINGNELVLTQASDGRKKVISYSMAKDYLRFPQE